MRSYCFICLEAFYEPSLAVMHSWYLGNHIKLTYKRTYNRIYTLTWFKASLDARQRLN